MEPEDTGEFTLSLRIPAWAKGASACVNGVAQAMTTERGYLKITRAWAKGDTVRSPSIKRVISGALRW